MTSKKIAIFVIFAMGVTLIILGGVYNPYSEVINLPSGSFRALGLKLDGGEVETYNLHSLNTFTIYIMNKTKFDMLLDNGTFNSSYYTFTGKDVNLEFRAPSTDIYYIVIANFNSKMSIEVDFSYHKSADWFLIVIGTVVVGISFVFMGFEIIESKKKPALDKVCPECGRKVNGSWNYCPYCRCDLRGHKDER